MTATFTDRRQERDGSAGVPTRVLNNLLLECLLAHYSVRAFLNQLLPEGKLETLVAAASRAYGCRASTNDQVPRVSSESLSSRSTR